MDDAPAPIEKGQASSSDQQVKTSLPALSQAVLEAAAVETPAPARSQNKLQIDTVQRKKVGASL